ncbi:hypothetical protein M9458_029680 [Cirrhinus mrigala]|uniref:Uncharacterized protein n=1 Tax=Cirrhinus mrigala TaxID=683832 RepID=A0ABD0PIR4_CIRMR
MYTSPFQMAVLYTSPSYISSSLVPQSPAKASRDKVPSHKALSATYDVSLNVHCQHLNVLTSSTMPSSSSFCVRPPIRFEFPTFGNSCETADVLNFVEQCENFLKIRPLPSAELSERTCTELTDWKSFKNALMAAFLSDDYLLEVEKKLNMMLGISDEELVSPILNNMNPRVAGCLQGTANTVKQLLKVGSLVEKDCMGAKDYWLKVVTQNNKVKNSKTAAKHTSNKNLAGVTLAQAHPIMSLLGVPVKVNAQEVKAVIDTGSTFTLMQEKEWYQLKGKAQSVITSIPQRCIMADGTIHQTRDLQKIHYQWHDKDFSVNTYILKDTHLAFPPIAALNFLSATGDILELGQGKYGLPSGKGYIYHPFLPSSSPAARTAKPSDPEHSLMVARLSLYYALPPIGGLPELAPFIPELTQWDSRKS